METRHPAEGQFGSELPVICNHCWVTTAWIRKNWKFCEQFLRFLGKMTPHGKILKILFQKFSPPYRSTLLCSNVVKFARREIGEIMSFLRTKNFDCLSNCRYCTDYAQNLPGWAPNIWLTLFQISCKSVYFRRSYSRTREGRFRVFSW